MKRYLIVASLGVLVGTAMISYFFAPEQKTEEMLGSGMTGSVWYLNPLKQIQTGANTWGLKIPSLASPNNCLVTDATGVVTTGPCGTGSGGGGGMTVYFQNGGATLNVATTTVNFTPNSFTVVENPDDTLTIRVATTTLGLLTTNVSEGSNLYYTDTRARAAITESITGMTFTTGVLTVDSGYVLPTTTRATNWDTAFGWGNHASQGYITDGNTNWDNSYGFVTSGQTVGTSTAGVAGQASYWTGIRTLGTVATGTLTENALGLEFDNSTRGLFGGSAALSLTSGYTIPSTTRATNWDTAFGWGNHAVAGYALSSAIPARDWIQTAGYLVPTTTIGVNLGGHSIFANYAATNGSTTNATSTNMYIGTALRGAGLASCSDGITSKLLWNASTGQFSCGTDQSGGGGGSGGGFATTTDTNNEAGELVTYTAYDAYIGGSASNTAEFNFDKDAARFTISSTTANATATIRTIAGGIELGKSGGESIEFNFNTADTLKLFSTTGITAFDLGAIRASSSYASTTGLSAATICLSGDCKSAWPVSSGDVTKVGTPVDNQVGVWTGDGTIEGDSAFTFDTATDILTTGLIVQSSGNNDLTLKTGNVTTGSITIADGANGDIALGANGSGNVVVSASGGTTELYVENGNYASYVNATAADNSLAQMQAWAEDGSQALFQAIAGSTYVGIIDTDSGMSGPRLDLYHNSASPAASDEVGQVRFFGEDSASNKQEYANIKATITDTTSASEYGFLTFQTLDNGVLGNRVFISGSGLSPATNDGVRLGQSSLQWSDLFLAEGGVINWDNGDATLTQVGNEVTLAGAGLVTPNATSTNLAVATGLQLFGGGYVTTANALCIQLTGSAALCDGSDGGGGGSSNWLFDGSRLTPSTTPVGISVTASSTIGDGTATGGLTVSGGATTTGVMKTRGLTSGTNNLVGSTHFAVGDSNWATSSSYSGAIGQYNWITGNSSFATGYNNDVYSNYSVATGWGNEIGATNHYSIVSGYNNTINSGGGGSNAYFGALHEGGNQGAYQFTAGNSNDLTGARDEVFVLGFNNTVEGYYSGAFGTQNLVMRDGGGSWPDSSVAIGNGNYINKTTSYAIGQENQVLGTNAIAIGREVKASSTDSHVIGTGISYANPLTATVPGLFVGYNSTIPTFVVSQASGIGTLGAVGIGSSTPSRLLTVGGDIYTANITATGSATTTNLAVSTGINLFGGGYKTTANELCIQLTGSAALCDGTDATSAGGGGISTSSIPTAGNLSYWTSATTLGDVATGTLTTTATGLELSATRGLVGGASVLSLTSGYFVPTTTRATNWDTAFSWGNHATQGYVTQGQTVGTTTAGVAGQGAYWTGARTLGTVATGTLTENVLGLELDSSVRGLWGGSAQFALTSGYSIPSTTRMALWDNASGTVTSVAMTVPTGFTISGTPVTSAGTLGLGFTAGYFLPTTTRAATWDLAHSWGNHATQGYITDGNTGWDNTYGLITATNATATITTATTTNLAIPTSLSLFGGEKVTTANALCIQLTGSAALCDGTDATSVGGGGISTSSIPVAGNLTYWTSANTVSDVATGTLTTTVTGLELSATRGLVGGSSILSLTSGYFVPTTTRAANWDTAFSWGNHGAAGYVTQGQTVGTTTAGVLGQASYWTGARTLGTVATGTLTESVLGLELDNATRGLFGGSAALSLSSGYFIPTTTRAATWDLANSWGNHAVAGYISDGNTGWDNTYGLITATNATATITTATTTNLAVPTSLALFGGEKVTTANALCIQLTGSAALCDGSDDGGGGGGELSDWQLGGVGYITPTTTVGISVVSSSTIQLLSMVNSTTTNATTTNLRVSGSFNFLGDVITNVATWFSTKLNAVTSFVATAASTWDFGGAESLEVPNGTAPTVNATGEIAYDTTDDQLLVADSGGTVRVIGHDEFRVISITMASSSLQFDSGDTLPVLGYKDGLEITQYRCYVVGGTSKVVNLTDGTNDTETITCGTTMTSDTDVATNDTFTADELGYLEMGATTGTVNYLHFEAWARITRE